MTLHPHAKGSHDPRSGSTLLEAVASIGILVTFLASVGGVVSSSFGAYVDMTATQTAEELTNRLMDRIVWEVRFIQLDTLELAQPTDARSISYRKVVGWEPGGALLSPTQTLSFVSGKVLASNVPIADKVHDLTFNLSGRTLRVTVSVEKTVHTAGHQHTSTLIREVKVAL